jgi:hypothetical protein
MTSAGQLFESALEWLRENYDQFLFRNENDIVTVLWARMVKVAKAQGLPFEVDYEQSFSVSSFERRLQCDIVVFGTNRKPLACIEVKFEPARTRPDTALRAPKIGRIQHLLPGHGLKDHHCDIERLPLYVEKVGAEVAYAVFIDEDSHHHASFDSSQLPVGTSWIVWTPKARDGFKTAVMLAQFPAVDS